MVRGIFCFAKFHQGEAYLYDLGSVHGTFLGKKRIEPRTYVPIVRGKNVFKFGQSSRLYILDHPEKEEGEDQEEEDEEGVEGEDPEVTRKRKERKEKRAKQKEAQKQKWKEMREKKKAMKKQQKKLNDPFGEEEDKDSDGEDKDVDLDEDFGLKDEHAEFYKEYFEEDDDDAFYDRTGRIGKHLPSVSSNIFREKEQSQNGYGTNDRNLRYIDGKSKDHSCTT